MVLNANSGHLCGILPGVPDGIFVSLLTISPNLKCHPLGREWLAKNEGKKSGMFLFFFLILAFNSVMKIIICALSFSL